MIYHYILYWLYGLLNGLMNELIEQYLKTHVLEGEYNQEELEKFLEILKKV